MFDNSTFPSSNSTLSSRIQFLTVYQNVLSFELRPCDTFVSTTQTNILLTGVVNVTLWLGGLKLWTRRLMAKNSQYVGNSVNFWLKANHQSPSHFLQTRIAQNANTFLRFHVFLFSLQRVTLSSTHENCNSLLPLPPWAMVLCEYF